MIVPLNGSLDLEHISKEKKNLRPQGNSSQISEKKAIPQVPSVVSLWGRLNELCSVVLLPLKPEGEATALCGEGCEDS